MLLLVNVEDLHGIVHFGITFEKCVEQGEAKHLPLLGSYNELNRFEGRLKLVRVLNFYIMREELLVIY